MRSRLLALSASVTLATSLAGADSPTPPARFEVLAALVRGAGAPLARGEACGDVVGEPVRSPTLGDWIAYNLSLFEGPSTVAVSCRPVPERALFECDVEFRTEQGTDSPWNWGVRARFVRRTGKLRMAPGRFTCIGAG